MGYSPVSWAYKDPITVQKLNQMGDNSVFTSEHRIAGCEIDVTGTSTVIVQGGKIELNGKWLSRNGSLTALTAENNAHWEEGTSQENATGSAQAFYIVAYNDSGSSFNVKFRASGPAYSDTLSGTSTGPKQYDKTGTVWYRYIGAVYNATGGLTHQRQVKDEVQYDEAIELTTSQSSGAWTVLPCFPAIPAISRRGVFRLVADNNANDAQIYIRAAGATGTTSGTPFIGGGKHTTDTIANMGGVVPCITDSSQQIEYRTYVSNNKTSIKVIGYTIDR